VSSAFFLNILYTDDNLAEMAFGSWFVERIEKEAKEAVVYRGEGASRPARTLMVETPSSRSASYVCAVS
jgi:hypothetical protein